VYKMGYLKFVIFGQGKNSAKFCLLYFLPHYCFMKVSGFTIVRNAVKYDFPVVESILSILPICDEFIVAVGKSEDETLQLIQSIGSPKIKILETVWDESLREGGRVLAVETDKAFQAVAVDSDWAFYLQADEVVHENGVPAIKEALLKWKDTKEVEGLLFNYKHFFATYDYVADSRKWYRNEIRVIRNDKDINSYKDAISFRKQGRKLNVKVVAASVYHYGWVKNPKVQIEKRKSFEKMWHDDEWIKQHFTEVEEFDYSNIDSLAPFKGTHPAVMKKRIESRTWDYKYNPVKKVKMSFRVKALNYIYKKTGWHIGENRNYKISKAKQDRPS